jgi:hypothetical protein
MNRLKISLLALSLCSVALGGCATVFKSKEAVVSVTSNTPGATVLVGGRPMGVTPTTLKLSNKASAVITVQVAGREQTCQLQSNASVGWAVADFLLTSPLGMVIDWVTHNWNNLAPGSCHVDV